MNSFFNYNLVTLKYISPNRNTETKLKNARLNSIHKPLKTIKNHVKTFFSYSWLYNYFLGSLANNFDQFLRKIAS